MYRGEGAIDRGRHAIHLGCLPRWERVRVRHLNAIGVFGTCAHILLLFDADEMGWGTVNEF